MEKKEVLEEMKDIPQLAKPSFEFPKRPILSANPTGKKVKLTTNFYTINLKSQNYIYVYSVKLEEEIPDKNTPLRKKIVRGMAKILEGVFMKYFFTGTLLYSTKDIGKEPQRFETAEGGVKYIVEFIQSHLISLQDILTPHKDPKKAQTANTFFNIVIKSLLSSLNMIPVGRTGKYLLPSESKPLNDYGIMVWPGYKTSVRLCESGLLLEVDYASRILQQKSVYELLKEIQHQCTNFEGEVKDALIGKSVIGRYGNKRNYVVTDIDFKHNPVTFEFDTVKGRVNMDTYYSQKYGLKIQDKKQPLIVSAKKNRDGVEEKTYLVQNYVDLQDYLMV